MHDQPVAIVHPGESSINLPARLVHWFCLDRTTTLRFLALALLKGWNRYQDAPFARLSSEGATIARLISRQRFGPSARRNVFLGRSDRLQRLIEESNFMRLSAIQAQTNLPAISTRYQHHFAAFANFGIADPATPFFVGTKFLFRKICSHSSFSRASSLLNKARQISSLVSPSDHWLNCCQQVIVELCSAGISCQSQPAFRRYRMPLSICRSSTRERPVPGLRLGISGSMVPIVS